MEYPVDEAPFHPRSSEIVIEKLSERDSYQCREKEKRRKKSGAKSKWRFNYNGRLITAIAHHEPSYSRNSRIIRASGLRRENEGITDFPADILHTLENSSLFPRALMLQPPSARTHTEKMHTNLYRARARWLSFSKDLIFSRSQYVYSLSIYIPVGCNVSPLLVFVYLPTSNKEDEMCSAGFRHCNQEKKLVSE